MRTNVELDSLEEWLEPLLWVWKVSGLNPARVIPRTLQMAHAASLPDAQNLKKQDRVRTYNHMLAILAQALMGLMAWDVQLPNRWEEDILLLLCWSSLQANMWQGGQTVWKHRRIYIINGLLTLHYNTWLCSMTLHDTFNVLSLMRNAQFNVLCRIVMNAVH